MYINTTKRYSWSDTIKKQNHKMQKIKKKDTLEIKRKIHSFIAAASVDDDDDG